MDFQNILALEKNAPVQERQIAKMENQWDMVFPGVYRSLLLQSNGFYSMFCIFYNLEELEEINKAYEVWTYLPGYLLIGNDHGDYGFFMKAAAQEQRFYQIEFGNLFLDTLEENASFDLEKWIAGGCWEGIAPKESYEYEKSYDPVRAKEIKKICEQAQKQMKAGAYEKAKALFTELLLLPDFERYSFPYRDLYQCCLRVGDKLEAYTYLKQWYAQQKRNERIAVEYAGLAMELGEITDAKEAVKDVLAVNPRHGTALAILEKLNRRL